MNLCATSFLYVAEAACASCWSTGSADWSALSRSIKDSSRLLCSNICAWLAFQPTISITLIRSCVLFGPFNCKGRATHSKTPWSHTSKVKYKQNRPRFIALSMCGHNKATETAQYMRKAIKYWHLPLGDLWQNITSETAHHCRASTSPNCQQCVHCL